MGRWELRRVRSVRFTELGKAGMDGIEIMWRIGVLEPKVFPAKAARKKATSAFKF